MPKPETVEHPEHPQHPDNNGGAVSAFAQGLEHPPAEHDQVKNFVHDLQDTQAASANLALALAVTPPANHDLGKKVSEFVQVMHDTPPADPHDFGLDVSHVIHTELG